MPRTLCTCSTDRCGRFTAFWRPLLGSGRVGKHQRAPQEDASAALTLDPRSCDDELELDYYEGNDEREECELCDDYEVSLPGAMASKGQM
ncbi:hypothetical protein NDU88_006245 [Pleurodeles waltl]|uniref:Uncharacterized protein n=1 Tax=Pleurodeles waltl TaxID=8319 RepID=A0AAV7QK93_PLEWA|nr:hypothetical protein NDU88_006245 [Pleurodeles waltl]